MTQFGDGIDRHCLWAGCGELKKKIVSRIIFKF